jgi:hypothetical protein
MKFPQVAIFHWNEREEVKYFASPGENRMLTDWFGFTNGQLVAVLEDHLTYRDPYYLVEFKYYEDGRQYRYSVHPDNLIFLGEL